jgi:hypothetical protein
MPETVRLPSYAFRRTGANQGPMAQPVNASFLGFPEDVLLRFNALTAPSSQRRQ